MYETEPRRDSLEWQLRLPICKSKGEMADPLVAALPRANPNLYLVTLSKTLLYRTG